jgi:hypothetical protein
VSESQAEGQGGAPREEPSAEQLAEQVANELRKARVSDLLVESCSVIASLGYAKLAPDTRDLDQARLAVEALKALAPLLPEEPARNIRQVVANLQLAYADAAAAPAPEGESSAPNSESRAG